MFVFKASGTVTQVPLALLALLALLLVRLLYLLYCFTARRSRAPEGPARQSGGTWGSTPSPAYISTHIVV
jgi:hypothetical protein